jgi:hypothetical protein
VVRLTLARPIYLLILFCIGPPHAFALAYLQRSGHHPVRMRSRTLPRGGCIMIFLELAIGAMAAALLAVPVLIAVSGKGKVAGEKRSG